MKFPLLTKLFEPSPRPHRHVSSRTACAHYVQGQALRGVRTPPGASPESQSVLLGVLPKAVPKSFSYVLVVRLEGLVWARLGHWPFGLRIVLSSQGINQAAWRTIGMCPVTAHLAA